MCDFVPLTLELDIFLLPKMVSSNIPSVCHWLYKQIVPRQTHNIAWANFALLDLFCNMQAIKCSSGSFWSLVIFLETELILNSSSWLLSCGYWPPEWHWLISYKPLKFQQDMLHLFSFHFPQVEFPDRSDPCSVSMCHWVSFEQTCCLSLSDRSRSVIDEVH